MMQISYIFMGMFLDDTAMLVIVAPLYVPLIIALGLILFGMSALYYNLSNSLYDTTIWV